MEISKLVTFRKELHKNPELSGSETDTAKRISKELNKLHPDRILNGLGGEGVAVKFSASGNTAKTVLFRAELDAIAVHEESGVDYRSEKDGVMHGCGHDGHMSILIGVARQLAKKRPEHTDVWLLFQPSEENGKGADAVLRAPQFEEVNPDQAFALHNLPGYSESSVIIRNGVFAAASTGLLVRFEGRSSHAAYPEQGLNPAPYVARLTEQVESELAEFRDSGVINKAVTSYISLGEKAFGINPGRGEVGFTVRSASDKQLEMVLQQIEEIAAGLKSEFEGKVHLERVEPFSATENDPAGAEIVRSAAEELGLELIEPNTPFPWSEDFGEFGRKFPITLFGLGSGEEHPHLHSERYDFNDRLLETMILMIGYLKLE
jgi:amidohydrolase